MRDYNDYLSFRETPIDYPELNIVEGEPGLEVAPSPTSAFTKVVDRQSQLSDSERALEAMNKQVRDLKRRIHELEMKVADKDEKLKQSR